ncbi:hypothetical protein LSAT2_007121 [Lamellibrachia satsuma]|nr:hypothetical protein LSAT2_007121 [Lamellibrachia satsuma]
MSKKEKERLHIREDLVSRQAEVYCFMDEMNSFYQSEQDRKVGNGRFYPKNTSLTLPAGELEGRLVMNHNPSIYSNSTNLPADFWRYFEVMTSFWLYNAFQPPFPSEQLTDYSSMVGEAKLPETEVVPLPSRGQNNKWTYEYGTRLRYAAIAISTVMERANLGFKKGLPIRDAWEDFLDNEKKTMPDTLKGGFQISYENAEDNLWHWLTLQKTLLTTALTGLGVGLGIALPILIFATANVITGLLATCSIILSTLSVVAVIPLGGWKLGLMESINLTLVVGLSVDYVVHLAEGYSRSSHSKRLGRLHDSLAQVGVSVLSGACTTIGGSAFLLLAEIILFMQFGVFMFATILFSIVFALGFFSTTLGIFGPEDDRGSIKPFKHWLWKVVTCKICKK